MVGDRPRAEAQGLQRADSRRSGEVEQYIVRVAQLVGAPEVDAKIPLRQAQRRGKPRCPDVARGVVVLNK